MGYSECRSYQSYLVTVRSFDGASTIMASDHRMTCVEVVDNCSILGKHLPSSRKIKASKFKSTDPRARNKYNCRVKKRYGEAKVGFQCTALQELVKEFAACGVTTSSTG